MKAICFLLALITVSTTFSQEVFKRNLTKRTSYYYDLNRSKIESVGSFYKDDLGETQTKHGQWKYYDKAGKLSEIMNYYKGELHGIVTVYFPNGKKQSEGFFVMGAQDSTYTEWYETSFVKTKGNYDLDQPIGLWEYFYLDGREKMIEEIIDSVSYLRQFWVADSAHTHSLKDGTGDMITL